MIKPEQFDIVKRHDAEAYRVRIVVEKISKDNPTGTFIWMTSKRDDLAYGSLVEASGAALEMGRGLFGDVFRAGMVKYFQTRMLIPTEKS
jgi:hypothetical protein